LSVIVDTNILVRFVVDDDPAQSRLARALFLTTELLVIPSVALCEAVWVLSRSYKLPLVDIADAIRRLTVAENVRVDRPTIDAGLAQIDAGGDFADGVIAYDGRGLGGETFVSFDRAAVRRLNAQGIAAKVPA